MTDPIEEKKQQVAEKVKRKRPRTLQGRFTPKNPSKYLGNVKNIIFRSSWELRLFKYLDLTPAILRWASEEFSIPYMSPVDGQVHQYFPDAFIIYRNKSGDILKEIIEIKPSSESKVTDEDLAKLKGTKQEQTNLVNKAKWNAAARFAELNGMKFRVITEKTLFVSKKKVKK